MAIVTQQKWECLVNLQNQRFREVKVFYLAAIDKEFGYQGFECRYRFKFWLFFLFCLDLDTLLRFELLFFLRLCFLFLPCRLFRFGRLLFSGLLFLTNMSTLDGLVFFGWLFHHHILPLLVNCPLSHLLDLFLLRRSVLMNRIRCDSLFGFTLLNLRLFIFWLNLHLSVIFLYFLLLALIDLYLCFVVAANLFTLGWLFIRLLRGLIRLLLLLLIRRLTRLFFKRMLLRLLLCWLLYWVRFGSGLLLRWLTRRLFRLLIRLDIRDLSLVLFALLRLPG